jgi:hypothetical protein
MYLKSTLSNENFPPQVLHKRKNILKNETLARDGILFFEMFLLLFFPLIFDKYTLRITGKTNVSANLHKE